MSHLQSPHSSSEGGAPDDEKVRHLEVLLQDSKKDALRSKTAAEEAMQRLQGLRAMDVDRVDALVEQVALPSGVCFCGVCFCGVRARLASLCESSVQDRQTETETETETDRLCVCVCVCLCWPPPTPLPRPLPQCFAHLVSGVMSGLSRQFLKRKSKSTCAFS